MSIEDKGQLIELLNHQHKRLKRYFIDNEHINNLPKEVVFLAKIQIEEIENIFYNLEGPYNEYNEVKFLNSLIDKINILLVERDMHMADRNHLELYCKMVQLDKNMGEISRRLDRIEQSIKPKPEDKWIRTVKIDV